MNEKYGVKFREIYNRETKRTRKVYSAIIYKEDAIDGIAFVSSGGEILEFKTREEALNKAKEVYEKFKGELWD